MENDSRKKSLSPPFLFGVSGTRPAVRPPTDDEDTVKIRHPGLAGRRASSIFPDPAKIHAATDEFEGDCREREAALLRENESLRHQRDTAIADRDSYREAVRSMQELVEKRDEEKRILKRALGR